MSNHAYIVSITQPPSTCTLASANGKRYYETITWICVLWGLSAPSIRATAAYIVKWKRSSSEIGHSMRYFAMGISLFLEGNAIANICIWDALRTHSNGCYEMNAHELYVRCAMWTCTGRIVVRNRFVNCCWACDILDISWYAHIHAYAQFLVHATWAQHTQHSALLLQLCSDGSVFWPLLKWPFRTKHCHFWWCPSFSVIEQPLALTIQFMRAISAPGWESTIHRT